jgi:hypothetical protein
MERKRAKNATTWGIALACTHGADLRDTARARTIKTKYCKNITKIPTITRLQRMAKVLG